MSSLYSIKELLRRIESFQIIKCGLYHEKVAEDVNNKPLYKSQENTIVFQRVKLCNDRVLRLGCAHSGVNNRFENSLEKLAVVFPQKKTEISKFKEAFRIIITAIYKLDHHMGQVEHDLASCELNEDYLTHKVLLISKADLRVKHNSHMNELSKLKSEIEQFIKLQMNYDT